MITQKEVRRQLSYDKITGILRWKISKSGVQKGDIAGSLNSKGYVVITINGTTYRAHRLIWLGKTGKFPQQIDHWNRIKSDNSWNNLRDVSQSQNMQNTGIRKDNTSGVKGVGFSNGKWNARIKHLNKNIYLGRFSSFEEAVCHRLAAEQCLGWNTN